MPDGVQCSASPLIADWLQEMQQGRSDFAAMLRAPADGYRDTIREICQQPATWAATARRLATYQALAASSLDSCRQVVLTGSGSSQYAGECAAPALRRDFGRPVEVAGGGELLLRRRSSVAGEPTLVVSLARSGESPESAAAVETLLETEPQTRHLVVTCNAQGKLAREFAGDPRVRVIDLGSHLNDRSLVMTGSFTNLVLGARFLGWVERTGEFAAMADRIDAAGRQLLRTWPDCLGGLVRGGIQRVVFLGSGARFSACREGALKLLEMTGGRVATMAETYLGLRHGPMSFLDERTLVVCFLSSDPLVREYERDLIAELNAKHLGARKLIAGAGDPGEGLCQDQDMAIAYAVPRDTADDDLVLLDAMIAQILGFHRCLEEGLQPDSPSVNQVISRVVGEFRIHRAEAAPK